MKLKLLRTQTQHFQSPSEPKPTFQSLSSSSESAPQQLTQQDITKINLLVPHLCLTNNINAAIHLTITALLTNPPPKSLSFSILTHSFTSQPHLALPMSLLTKLKHTPQAHPHLTPITTLLPSSYLKKGRPKDALRVYNWMLRPGYPCIVEMLVFYFLVDGLCRSGLVVEALRVLGDMLGMDLVVGGGLRKRIFTNLLREAKEVDEALLCVHHGEGGGEDMKKVLALLDQIIANWTE